MNSLVSQSQFYDWQFNLLILDSNTIDGYACPGGFLFITKGAILSCKNEAELAALIAHEAAHVIQRHGMQEIFERRTHIKMDKAFQELEAETGPEENPEIIALEESMITSYDKIVSSRLLEYELEADKIAAVLCANAGYDPFSLSRITERISMQYEETTDIFDDNYLAPNEMLIRANTIKEFNEDEFSSGNAGLLMKERFVKNTGEIR